MADTIASLFGPTPEQIEYDRQQAERRRRDDLYATNLAAFKGDLPGFATGYALGTGVGEGLGQAAQGIFGMEPMKDPSLAKSKKSREILREFSTSNLDDPTVLSKMARVFADNDMPEQAMAIQAQARQLKSNQPEQFYTATGAELMASNPAQYKGLNKKATYEVSTKTGKPNEIVAAKDADKDPSEVPDISGRQLGSLNTITAIDEALELADEFGTTGFIGAVQRKFGTLSDFTDAGALGRTVETIQANIGFNRLQQMRDESKTGGALGQVALRELDMLQATIATLRPGMEREKFKANLRKIKSQYFAAMSEIPPELLQQYGFDPRLSKNYKVEKSIDVSGKVNSKGGTSATSRYNELNAPSPDNYVERR